MPILSEVAVYPTYGQMAAAALLQTALEEINHRSRHGLKETASVPHELCYTGAGSLAIFYGVWNQPEHNLAERKLFIPSAHLTLDVLLIPQIAFDHVDTGLEEAEAGSKSLRYLTFINAAFQNFTALVLQKAHPHSDGLVVHHAYFDTHRPRGRLQGYVNTCRFPPEHLATVATLHPAHFFIRVLERIRVESVNKVLALNDAAKFLHSHRRSAQVFLLRLFAELLEDTIHSDPTKSDAIWKPHLETALPRGYDNFNEFVAGVTRVLTPEVAKEQAAWQLALKDVDRRDLEAPFEALLERNLRAFDNVLNWLHPAESLIHPPPHDHLVRSNPPPPPPPPTNSVAPMGNPFLPGPR